MSTTDDAVVDGAEAQRDGGDRDGAGTVGPTADPLGARRLPIVEGLRVVWRADRPACLRLAVLSLFEGVSAAAVPLAVAVLLDRVLLARTFADIRAGELVAPLAVLALAVGSERVVTVWRNGLFESLAFEVRVAAEREIVDVAASVDVEAFEAAEFYDRLERALDAATMRPVQLVQALLSSVTAVAGGIGTAVAVVALEPLTFGLALTAFAPAWWLAQRRSTVRLGFLIETTPTERRMSYFRSVLTDRAAAKEVRLFGADRFFDGRRRQAVADRRAEVAREVRDLRRVDIEHLVLSSVVTVITWAVVFALARRGGGTPAEVAAFGFAFLRLRTFLLTLSLNLVQTTEAGLLLGDVHALHEVGERPDGAPPALSRPTAGPPLPPLEALALRSVSYTYPGAPAPAVHEVSLDLRRGEFVAVVGPNGSGKTTLAMLLCSLLVPQSGELAWNGDPLPARAGPCPLAGRAGAVFQDSSAFTLSAADNVRLGRAAPAGRLDDVLAEVGMATVVESLPAGRETLLGREFEGGTDLSGGEWQRLMVARGLFDTDVDVVVLDEASSDLDPVAELELVRSVKRLSRDRLVIVVSHRLSSIVDASRVVVMGGGTVVQQGSPTELLRVPGPFAEMFNLQARALGFGPEAAATGHGHGA